ncbi:MAG: TonB-dependent receptor [Bacteroidetes bacterium]|nr:TonB-dependent receptor [Bacteroidota bacterium]
MSKKFFAFLAALMGSHFLFAQNDTTGKQLDEVVVTASKSNMKQSQTGKVITVISHDEINKSVAKTLGQLLNEQAGITINGALNNAGSNQSIYMRGAASGRTLILIDGIPVYDPSISDNSFDINLIPVDNIERIEICKGAQSTLYGSDAIAGVINIITIKQNIQNPFNAKATLAGGNYGTIRGNAQLYGKIADAFVYNVRYSKYKTDGFSTAYDSSSKSNFDKDGYNGDALAANLAWNVTRQFTIKGFAQYSHYKTDLDGGAFTDARDYTNTSKNLMLGGGAVYKIAGTTISGNYQYSTYDRQLLEDSTYGQYYYNDKYFGKTQYVELFASSKIGSNLTWLNGADYRFSEMNEHSNYGNFTDTAAKQVSVYSSLFYAAKSGLNAEFGGRFNSHSRYGTNYTYTFNPSFVFNDEWKIYASVSSGFKAPTLFELYSSYGDKNLKPETSVNYEGGVQYSTKVFNSRVTYFSRKIKEGLDFDYINYVYYNFSLQNTHGIEWENKINITKQLSLNFNYTWIHTREEVQSRQPYAYDPVNFIYFFNKDTTYNYSLKRPEHSINASLGWKQNNKFFINVGLHYESKRYDAVYVSPDALLKSFVIFNAYTEYVFSKYVKAFVDAKNLANKKFFTINGYNSIPFIFTAGATVNL